MKFVVAVAIALCLTFSAAKGQLVIRMPVGGSVASSEAPEELEGNLPSAVTFQAVSGVAPLQEVVSESQPLVDFVGMIEVQVENGELDINESGEFRADQWVAPDDRIRIRVTSADGYDQTVTARLLTGAGTEIGTFSVTTAADAGGSWTPEMVAFEPSGQAYLHTWTVPQGVEEITVEMWGSGGGRAYEGALTYDFEESLARGGAGGYCLASVPVVAGETLTIHAAPPGTGSGGGGGYSALFRDPPDTPPSDRGDPAELVPLVVVGGGGAGGVSETFDSEVIGFAYGTGGGGGGCNLPGGDGQPALHPLIVGDASGTAGRGATAFGPGTGGVTIGSVDQRNFSGVVGDAFLGGNANSNPSMYVSATYGSATGGGHGLFYSLEALRGGGGGGGGYFGGGGGATVFRATSSPDWDPHDRGMGAGGGGGSGFAAGEVTIVDSCSAVDHLPCRLDGENNTGFGADNRSGSPIVAVGGPGKVKICTGNHSGCGNAQSRDSIPDFLSFPPVMDALEDTTVESADNLVISGFDGPIFLQIGGHETAEARVSSNGGSSWRAWTEEMIKVEEGNRVQLRVRSGSIEGEARSASVSTMEGTKVGEFLAVRGSGSVSYFGATGSDRSFTVPDGVSEISVKMWGAGGGSGTATKAGAQYAVGGAGGFCRAKIAVSPNQELILRVGEGGTYANAGGGGGGYSAILDTMSNTPLLVVGGGGGSGRGYEYTHTYLGGGGGGGCDNQPGQDGARAQHSALKYWASIESGGKGGSISAGGAGGEALADDSPEVRDHPTKTNDNDWASYVNEPGVAGAAWAGGAGGGPAVADNGGWPGGAGGGKADEDPTYISVWGGGGGGGGYFGGGGGANPANGYYHYAGLGAGGGGGSGYHDPTKVVVDQSCQPTGAVQGRMVPCVKDSDLGNPGHGGYGGSSGPPGRDGLIVICVGDRVECD